MAEEQEFSRVVIKIATSLGWKLYRPGSLRGKYPQPAARGWPDLTFGKHGQLVIIETKGPKTRTRAGQEEWIALLDSVPGITAFIAYPTDLARVTEALNG
jgi:hypothetical protein